MSNNKFRETDSEKLKGWQLKLNEIIFGADTFSGKLFDVVLILAIVASVIAVCAESVSSIRELWGDWLYKLEWGFTLLFTLEYIVRIICVTRPTRYIFSFYGLVDLLSILPTYLSLMLSGVNSLLVIRILRVLRVFRILKLSEYLGEANFLVIAMRHSSRKIFIFLYVVLTITVVFGTIMYIVEGQENGFTSIPKSIYWAIVTLTTVGYGDITPQTTIGQFISSAVMICGYAIIAVPTGIYAAELSEAMRLQKDSVGCTGCGKTGHELDAEYCRICGEPLNK